MTENGATVAVAPVDRLCLRLDNGTRIGHSKVLDANRDADVIKLEFTEGVLKGLVSDDDLTRISEIAGRLDAQQRAAATAPTAKPQVCLGPTLNTTQMSPCWYWVRALDGKQPGDIVLSTLARPTSSVRTS